MDSDHGLHGMTLGPDGKLYFTVGDARYGADNVQAGEPTFDVTDKSGRRLSAARAGTGRAAGARGRGAPQPQRQDPEAAAQGAVPGSGTSLAGSEQGEHRR